MIHNVLTRQLPIPPARVDAVLAATGIAPTRRPQTLAVGEWLALAAALGPIGPDRRGRRHPHGDERRRTTDGPANRDRPAGIARRRPTAHACGPARPGQAQPDPGGRRAAAVTASTSSIR